MLVYLEDKSTFNEDVLENNIEDKILELMRQKLGMRVSQAEIRSWKNSLPHMDRVLNNAVIPDDAGIAIEYSIPQTSMRVDFIITGIDADEKQSAVIIELKQWETVSSTSKDAIVSTYIGGGVRETSHPSYQAWSYAALLKDFNEEARAKDVSLHPCAYLHNCVNAEVINDSFYKEHIDKAPPFLKTDAGKLRDFISQHVKKGDSGKLMYRIRDGKISPSKNLADKLASLLNGNTEFLMIDEQKLVYETAIHLGNKATATSKEVFIVEGGPGTGKSVVAINLLVNLIGRNKNTRYVTKNKAPRDVYESKLVGTITKTRFSNLFTSSGKYTDTKTGSFDSLIIDEAHRLNEKSNYFGKGENQIKEIINAANCCIFFIDEDQRVHFKDIGTKDEIKKWANAQHASVTELKLVSQFRCNGSEGYLGWVDNTLQIRKTANETLDDIDYEFNVCESPNGLQDKIFKLNNPNNSARIVAGYCWKWASKKNNAVDDIIIEKYNFSAKWNLTDDGNLWILNPESINEIGCIHTCQGLELDYIGVVIGPDLIVRNETVITRGEERASSDTTIHGYKKLLKESPEEAKAKVDMIIKNTYRTLMTRGQKGCYVFSTDPETNEYLKYSMGC